MNDEVSRVFGVTGGLGSGKTHGAIQIHYNLCVENQWSEFSWFTEPTSARIKDTAIPRWKKFLASIGLKEGIHYTFTFGHPVELRFLSGHKVLFLSAHNPDFMVGAEISHFTIDEPGHTKYDAFLNCMSRLRCPNATRHQGVVAGAPQGGGWFMDLFNFNGYDKEKKYRRFQIWTEDNVHHIGQAYIDQQKETYKPFPRKLRSYLYGEFVHFYEGVCITDFREETDITDCFTPDENAEIYMTWDFNAMPLTWLAVQILPFEFVLNDRIERVWNYCVHSETAGLEEGQVEDACAEFVKKFPPSYYRNTPIKVYGDRTGHAISHKVRHTDFQAIEKYLKPYYKNIEICATRKVSPQAESIEETNRLFSYNLVKIHPRCVNFINSLKLTKWKKGVREIDKPPGETWTHPLDAFKYLVYQLMRLDVVNSKRELLYRLAA